MISSKAGQRLAKAEERYQKALEGYERLMTPDTLKDCADAHEEFMQASHGLGRELIADGHHLVEGD